MHKRMEALTPQRPPGEVAEQRLRLLLGHLDRHLGCCLLPIELCAPGAKASARSNGYTHRTLMCNRNKVAPLVQAPHHGLDCA